jgi:hypothetical protein
MNIDIGNINANVHFREVFVEELNGNVWVGSEKEWGEFIKGTPLDDEFSCYVPDDVFNWYDDQELQDYVNENFYD